MYAVLYRLKLLFPVGVSLYSRVIVTVPQPSILAILFLVVILSASFAGI
jgi:hypothetical protein